MWKLHMTNEGRQWVEAGRFGSVTAAVRQIIELENYPGSGIHLEMHVLTVAADDDANDQEAFAHLEYTGKHALYVIKRAVQ